MYCTKCGVELRDLDIYCSQCGARTTLWAATAHPTVLRTEALRPEVLRLDKRNKRIAGVCAGFARYFGVDVVLVRVLWLLIALATGVGFLVYLGAWIAIPSDDGYEPPPLPVYVPQRR